MKIFFKFIVFIFLTLTSFGQSFITTQNINIRKGAGTKFEIIGTIPKGENIDIIAKTDIWGKVNYKSIEGYISTKFITKNASDNNNVNSTNTKTFSKYTTWLIIALVIILLVIFRNTIFVAALLSLIFGLLKGLLSDSNSSSSSTSRNTNVQNKPRAVVRCIRCGVLKSDATIPNICNGKITPHNYRYG